MKPSIYLLTLCCMACIESSAQIFSLTERKNSGKKHVAEVAPATPTTDDGDNYTKLTGLLVSSFGDDVVLQPGIIASRAWTKETFGAELRISGLLKNQDTSRFANATNLFKPEISNFHLRFAGTWQPKIQKNKKVIDHRLGINFEFNLYSQNLKASSSPEQNGNVSSMLTKVGLHWEPLDGVQFYVNGQLYNNLTGVSEFENRFGRDVNKHFLNVEISGQFLFNDGVTKGLFLQPVILINNSDTRKLTDAQNPVVFLIRAGFQKQI